MAKALYTCPGCGGKLEALGHPILVATITHTGNCLRNDRDDPDYVAALGALFDDREMLADGGIR